jgi:hypothetical protein
MGSPFDFRQKGGLKFLSPEFDGIHSPGYIGVWEKMASNFVFAPVSCAMTGTGGARNAFHDSGSFVAND